MSLILVVLGVTVTIIYWLQNNAVFGNLESTDTRHTALSIFQLFCLMLFLLSMKEGIDHGGSPVTRFVESLSFPLWGGCSALAYLHAIKNRRLLRDEVSDKDGKDLSFRIMAEPIAATITIFFVFTPILWEISWLSYHPDCATAGATGDQEKGPMMLFACSKMKHPPCSLRGVG